MMAMNGRGRRQDAVDEGDEAVTLNVGSPARQETVQWARQMSMGLPAAHQTRPKPLTTQRSVREISRSVTNSVADFFGLSENPEEQEKWQRRSIKLAKHKLMGGPVKPELERQGTIDSVFDSGSLGASLTASSFTGRPVATPYDPYSVARLGRQESQMSQRSMHMHRQFSRQCSVGSSRRVARMLSQTPHLPKRRDSVLKMAFDGVKSVVRAPSQKKVLKRQQSIHSRSFTPTSISSYQEEVDESRLTPASSVFFDESINDDVFFDIATPTSPWVGEGGQHPLQSATALASQDVNPFFPPCEILPTVTEDEAQPEDGKDQAASEPLMKPPEPEKPGPPSPLVSGGLQRRPTKSGWQVSQHVPAPPPAAEPQEPVQEADVAPGQGMRRIMTAILDNAFENSNRREIGKGIVGNIFNRSYRRERIDSYIQHQLEDLDDHRPYFTYWVTFVQIVVYVISIIVYGLAPLGFEETEIRDLVVKPSLAYERVAYFEPDNFWIGPRQADLIHLGAKYSPCMRQDQNVEKFIQSLRAAENETACCVKNDGSGCVQSSRSHCSATLSTWEKWPNANSPHQSGSVCGLDPRACANLSYIPNIWKDDITEWPICQEPLTKSKEQYPHMHCEILGRPCCTGIQGKCVITTREYCEFKRGYFHEEAFLCSQVSCMNEICGMIPFLDPNVPDQFYRLWTSLFLHAGLLQLVISVLFQFFIMRDLEKLAGWLRIGIIYIGSGIAGSLSSAIFLPYHVEAGPAGSQFGLLACLVVELVQNWYIVERPCRSLIKLIIVLAFLFGVGLLPMVDNWAHLVGFVFGFFLSFALLPYVTFGKFDRSRKLILVVTFLLSSIGVFIGLIIMFYVKPIYSCPGCQYFNCIPFTNKFCKTMAVNISTHTELEY